MEWDNGKGRVWSGDWEEPGPLEWLPKKKNNNKKTKNKKKKKPNKTLYLYLTIAKSTFMFNLHLICLLVVR